jgi:hypothetical protein
MALLGAGIPGRGRAAGAEGVSSWVVLYEQALTALAGDDVAAAVEAVARAARRAPPNHPYILYAQVRAAVRAGRLDQAFGVLGLLAEKGIAADVLISPSFEAMRDDPRWPEWQEKLQALVAPVASARSWWSTKSPAGRPTTQHSVRRASSACAGSRPTTGGARCTC